MEHLGHKLKLIDQLFKIRMNKSLEALNITVAQMHILMFIEHCDCKKVTQKMLTEHLGVRHSTTSGIISRMKEKGLISVTIDEQNKKFKIINTTEKAKQLKEQMDVNRDETEAIVVRGFSQEEQQQLKNFLDRLYDNLMNYGEISENDLKGFQHKIEHIGRRYGNDKDIR